MTQKFNSLFQYKRTISFAFVFLISSCLFFSVSFHFLQLINKTISSEVFVTSPMCHKQASSESKNKQKGVCCLNKLLFKERGLDLGLIRDVETVFVNKTFYGDLSKDYQINSFVFYRSENKVCFLGFSYFTHAPPIVS